MITIFNVERECSKHSLLRALEDESIPDSEIDKILEQLKAEEKKISSAYDEHAE